MCKRASLSCEWVKNDWDSIIPNLKSGNYDAIIAGMSITEERQKAIDFTEEYYPPDPSSFVGLAGASGSVTKGIVAAQTSTIHAGYLASSGATLVGLAGAGEAATKGVVAAQTATIHAGYVASSNATLVEFATAEETIAAVRNGEADVVLADSGYLKPIVAESNGELVFVGNQIQIGGGVGMGVRKSDGALRAKLNTAIASVKSDGTLNKMIAKWFGADSPQF